MAIWTIIKLYDGIKVLNNVSKFHEDVIKITGMVRNGVIKKR